MAALTEDQKILITNYFKSFPDDLIIMLLANHKYLNDTGINATYPKHFNAEESVLIQKIAQDEFTKRNLSQVTLDKYYLEADALDKADKLTVFRVNQFFENVRKKMIGKWVFWSIITIVVIAGVYHLGKYFKWWGKSN